MPKLKLTTVAVARITPPTEGRVDYFDTTLPAFGLRVSHTGARKYFLMTRVHGQLTRLTIGVAKVSESSTGLTLAEARKKAGELMESVSTGIDPRQQREIEKQANTEKSANTFKAIGERFMRQHVEPRLASSTQREYQRALFGTDTAAWANRPVASITRADVRAVLDTMVDRGSAGGANNLLAHLSKFFNWCAEKDLLEIPPTDRIKPPGPKNVGERTLNEAEIAEVWQAFGAEGGAFCDLFKLLLLTGQRRGEVVGMCRAELSCLDGDKPVWDIPSDRTKNSRPHSVPLAPQAVTIINARPEIGESGLLFTTTGKTPISAFSKTKERVDGRIARRREEAGLTAMPDWTLHDLRRTMVTMMNERLGIAPHVVESCVNHISGGAKAGVAGVYNKALYLTERRAAMIAWGEFVEILTATGE
jgi:integrase